MLTAAERSWFIESIQHLDATGRIVRVGEDKTRLLYAASIRSDEGRDRLADDEELVRALILCLLCSDRYGYEPGRLYIEQTHTIGRPSTTGAQVDLLIYYLDEGGSETPFAMWEIKAPSEYVVEMEAAIRHQLFATAPLINPTLLVYATVDPAKQRKAAVDFEALTIDYTSFKSFETWLAAGRPHT